MNQMRVGTDVGGTFTDLVAIGGGAIRTRKVPSVPQDQSQGFKAAIRDVVERPNEIVDVAHGSTVGVNALLERKTPMVALLCTKGHRDVLEIRRAWRPELFGNSWHRPDSLISRRLRLEVPERMDACGNVIQDLDEEAVRSLLTLTRAEGIPAAAVAFINSYANSAHEQRVLDIAKSEFPELHVVASTQILPEIGEYERTSTTVVAAMLRPVMDAYLSRLTDRLRELGADQASVRIMRSNGALMTLDGARANPVATLNSGPAGGVRACLEVGRAIGQGELLTFDMGGTSTEVAMIDDYSPLETRERDLEWNIPVRTTMLDIRSIGAGGGSIAYVDEGGALTVGPESAGAEPGPACYRKGGDRVTVTDAALVMGWIGSDAFLGGEMQLDPSAADRVIDVLAEEISLERVETAAAVMRIALAQMALLVREVSVNRGHDPRRFVLVPFGGAGPLVAAAIAEELSIPTVCVPRHASVFSALGGLMADIAYDYGRSYKGDLQDLDLVELQSACDGLANGAASRLERDQLPDATLEFSLDLHYEGASHSLRLPLDSNQGLCDSVESAGRAFTELHQRLYSFVRPDDGIWISAVRLRVTASQDKPALAPWTLGQQDPDPVGDRAVYFPPGGRFVDVPVYDRDTLASGSTLKGPCVVQEADTASLVHAGQNLEVDPFGNLLIRLGGRE